MIKILPGIGTIKLVLIVFAIGVSTGIYLTNKFYTAAKVNMLENYIDKQQQAHRVSINILENTHQEKLQIAKDSVQIGKVKIYVKDNRKCDLSIAAVKLLDNQRTGMPDATTITHAEAQIASTTTQRKQIEQCGKDGISFRGLKVDHDGLIDFVNANWK